MPSKKMGRLLAVSAVVGLGVEMSAAHAQVMAPPMRPPPTRVEIYSDTPKFEPGDDPANWSPGRNVVESHRYEQLVHTSPGFRAARIQRECGPITEPGLFQQCVASFDE